MAPQLDAKVSIFPCHRMTIHYRKYDCLRTEIETRLSMSQGRYAAAAEGHRGRCAGWGRIPARHLARWAWGRRQAGVGGRSRRRGYRRCRRCPGCGRAAARPPHRHPLPAAAAAAASCMHSRRRPVTAQPPCWERRHQGERGSCCSHTHPPNAVRAHHCWTTAPICSATP